MTEIALRFMEAVADEANTVVTYSRLMLDNQNDGEGEAANAVFTSVIEEELKHILEFTQAYITASGITAEDYEVEKDAEE